MLIKMMDNEDKADDNTSKGCRIVSNVIEVDYKIHPNGEAILHVEYFQPNRGLMGEDFVLRGNAYLLNDNGKTVNSFAASAYD